jgi:hypothetical protein
MVFAIDSAEDLHWVYPGYLDASEHPVSLALRPGSARHFLPEVVELEAPTAGPMRVLAAVSAEPIAVRAVEQSWSEGRSLSALSSASIKEWHCTWSKP